MMAETYKLHFLKKKAAKEAAKEAKESKTMEAEETQEVVDLMAQVTELQKKLGDKTSDFKEAMAVSTYKSRIIKNAGERSEALEKRKEFLELRNQFLEEQLVKLRDAAADHCEQHCRDYDELQRDAVDESVELRGKITRQAREIKNLLAKQKKHQPKHQPKHQKWTRQAKHQPRYQPKDQVRWTVVSSETSELMRKFPEFPRELFEMLP
jgi:hypothetical protein